MAREWRMTIMNDSNYKSGFVAVVGVPNAGKSTLMNTFLEQKIAIVSPRPQTTRTRQLGILTTDDHQIIFVDTPGLIKKAKHALDEAMIDVVLEAMEGADVILWIVDGTTPPSDTDRAVGEAIKPLSEQLPVILAINKIDGMTPDKLVAHSEAYRQLLPQPSPSPSQKEGDQEPPSLRGGLEGGQDGKWLAFSAKMGAGTDELLTMILDVLPEGPEFYPADQVTDTFMRDIAAEMIREQLLLQLDAEVPHASAVQVIEFKERENGMIYINAAIHIERETHKKIVIGKGGVQIKKISTAARKEIEKLVDARVFLELRVKVSPKWRTNRGLIERFGYVQ